MVLHRHGDQRLAGEIVREDAIRPLGGRERPGGDRQALSVFLNARTDLSPEMALRIEVALGPKAEVMMGVQTDHDMARPRAPARDYRYGPPHVSADLLIAIWQS